MSQDGKTKRVVVIGAGASGIGAARTLLAGGAEVIVLEGRDRIGGRMRKHCLTKNLLNSSGVETGANHFVNIQLGANWIHGMEAATNPMFEVAQKLGLELHQTSSDDDPGDDVILFDSGDAPIAGLNGSDKVSKVAYNLVSKEDYHESISRYEWIKEYVDHIQFNYEREDISLQAAFDLALTASESEIFGPCSAAQRRCLNWMYDRVSIDLGAHISKVSLNCYAEGVSDGAGGEALVKHVGYSAILDHLAHEFPIDIRLDKQVATITVCNSDPARVHEQSTFQCPTTAELEAVCEDLQRCTLKDGRYVRIECTNGETFVADACVVTVPVGALQAGAIKFSPRPPSVISSVCGSLKPGLMNLVWLWFPSVFWPDECNFLGVARPATAGADGAGDETIVKFSTFLVPPVFDNHGVRQPVLMCQIVGPYATTIESMSDAAIALEATATLRSMFGADAVPEPIGCAHSQWGSDPLARGSWSYFPYRPAPGADGNAASADPASASFTAASTTAGVSAQDTLASAAMVAAKAQECSERERAERDLQAGFASDGNSTDASYASSVFSYNANTASVTGGVSLSQVSTALSAARRVSNQPLSQHTAAIATAAVGAAPHRAVTIAEAAASVATTYTTGAPSPHSRKYSDFGLTSDGTDSGSSDSDTSDDEEGTSSSSSSSSDEDRTGATLRSEDEILSSHLCYASEAMSVLNRGTVHGAYMSGIREANKILAFLDVCGAK